MDGPRVCCSNKKEFNKNPSRTFNNYNYYFTTGLRNRYSKKRLATTSSMTVTLTLSDWAKLTQIAQRYRLDSLSRAIRICVMKYPVE